PGKCRGEGEHGARDLAYHASPILVGRGDLVRLSSCREWRRGLGRAVRNLLRYSGAGNVLDRRQTQAKARRRVDRIRSEDVERAFWSDPVRPQFLQGRRIFRLALLCGDPDFLGDPCQPCADLRRFAVPKWLAPLLTSYRFR